MISSEVRPEDDRATRLLVQLNELPGTKALRQKLSGRIGSENDGALLSAIHEAEAYLKVAGEPASG